MQNDDILRHLTRLPILADLSGREQQHVAELVREEWFGPGEVIIHEGDAGGPFFMIVEGRAEVTIADCSRRRLGPGDTFGELSILDGGQRSAMVRAETRMRILIMPSWSFLVVLADNWVVNRRVHAAMARRVRELDRH